MGIFVEEHARAVSLFDDVTVLYVRKAGGGSPAHTEVRRCEENGLTVIRREFSPGLPGTNILRYTWHVCRIFNQMRKQGYSPDIIHCHVFTSAFPAVLIKRLHGIPMVVTEHYTAFSSGMLKISDKLIARLALKRSDLILPVSEDLMEHMRSYGVTGRYDVLPNVFDEDIFYPPTAPPDAGERGARLLTVAGLVPKKGIDYLLEAVRDLRRDVPGLTLDIVGDGPERRRYEEICARYGIDDAVRFHGLLEKDAIAGIMRESDLFVLPSLFENLPCVLIEATACGMPVVATDVGGVSEIVDETNGILVRPCDSAELRHAIKYALRRLEQYDTLEIASRSRESYGGEVVGANLDRLYREVLRGARTGGRRKAAFIT